VDAILHTRAVRFPADAPDSRRNGSRQGNGKAQRSGSQLTEIPDAGPPRDGALLLIDQALEKLSQSDPLKVQLIEMRYFSGMTAEESAEALSLSVHVVRRELRLAQAWLRKQLA
jgi:DNA-directed RNA polymerase specialized sigma24 family protein